MRSSFDTPAMRELRPKGSERDREEQLSEARSGLSGQPAGSQAASLDSLGTSAYVVEAISSVARKLE